MTLNPETRKNLKQFTILSVAFLLVLTLFFNLPELIPTKAIGGGGGWNNFQTTVTTTNATTATRVVATNVDVKGNFITVFATPLERPVKVSSVTDTAGDSYSLIVQSNTRIDSEIWVANYTGTNNAANTITVTFNASVSSVIGYVIASGVHSTVYQSSTGSGTASPTTVGSFTPNNNGFCIGFSGIDTGSATALAVTTPAFFASNVITNVGATIFHAFAETSLGNWLNYGATTISTTVSPVSSPLWDMVAMCYQGGADTTTSTTTTTSNGMSAGIVQEKNSSTVTGTTNSLTLDYKPEQYNLLVEIGYIQTDTITQNTPTDNNGLTWTSLNSFLGQTKEIFAYGVNFSIARTTETITQTLPSSGTFQFRVFELTGITSNWNTLSQSLSKSGTTLAASLTSFTPPTNWLEIGALEYNIGDSSAHTWNTSRFTQFNSNLSSMQNRMGSTNYWSLADYYPQWNLGATTAIITPNVATSSSWLEVVYEFPTQISGIVTNTLTSTTTTTTTTSTTTSTTSSTTTTTPTTTTTTTTSLTNSTTTITSTLTSTNVTTITGTVIPEPAGSTDLLLIMLAIAIFLIMMIVGVLKRNPFPTLLGAIVLMIMNVGLYTNNKIVYSQNIITTPLWVNEMLTILVIFSFVLVVYQVAKRR